MPNLALAKSEPVQTIAEHTDSLLILYKQIRGLYPHLLDDHDWELLRYAVIYHDLGKIDQKFQNKILKTLGKPILKEDQQFAVFAHNYLSPAFIERQIFEDKIDYRLLCWVVYYHHARPMLDVEEEGQLRQYIKQVLAQNDGDFNMAFFHKPSKLNTNFISKIDLRRKDEDEATWHSFLKRYWMLKGLLNRLDHAASAGVEMIEEQALGQESIAQKTLLSLSKYQLRPAQQYMYENQEKNLIVIAATGTGKTEAALLWLGESKGFYTLPLKVSINVIYQRIKGKIGFGQVKLLHGDALSIYLAEDEQSYHLQYTVSKLFSSALTISTIDQLFKFVYRMNGGEAALATLSFSKLIIDEIQMYSPELVATLLVGLKTITEMGGQFAIITATFPEILYTYMDQLMIPYQKSQHFFYGPVPTRHRVKLLNDQYFDLTQIELLGKQKKVLVICNTVGNAQKLYEQLRGQAKVSLLHSAFIKRHRTRLEERILAFAPNEEGSEDIGIWISTHIVEASLDISFDILFTEMCAIDSLLQRMGRVYRSRSYDLVDVPNVYILNNKSGYGKVIDAEIYEYSLAALQQYDGQILWESEEKDDKNTMLRLVYDPLENSNILTSAYTKAIQRKCQELQSLEMYVFDKKTVNEKFRNIDAVTIMPSSIYEQMKNQGLVDQYAKTLKNNKISPSEKQKIKDQIYDHTLSITHYHNLVIDWAKELFYKGSNIYLYSGEYDYSDEFGGKGLLKQYRDTTKLDEINPFL